MGVYFAYMIQFNFMIMMHRAYVGVVETNTPSVPNYLFDSIKNGVPNYMSFS